ncbi:MAG: antitermination protein NusG [Mariniblastus sp.]|nr:antitermination protein NusG [Mariniblastus sp.]
MPILGQEDDLYPANLFDDAEAQANAERQWWCIYTLSRREKDLMRKLASLKIAHYGPVIPKRYRSPNGRLRTSFVPLFPNYVFMFGDEDDRYQAMTTNCISRCSLIEDREQLVVDLRQIHNVVDAGVALTPEARLEAGNRVRVRTGPFAGYEGSVVRREGKTRLLLSIQFIEQCVSMEMDEGVLEPL